jgi:hypothetical protein
MAGKDVPEAARQEAIERAEAGERITHGGRRCVQIPHSAEFADRRQGQRMPPGNSLARGPNRSYRADV